MGVLGQIALKHAGSWGGEWIGKKIYGERGGNLGRNLGSTIGSTIGTQIPIFHKGGYVGKGKKKRRNELAILQTGETVIPIGVKVTKKQKKAIKKLHHKFK